ncbi:MAG: carboxy terminal-processing peptidase [Pirellulaceae bacterium]|nr:carboxy terminal-processing peptidase [Planctomycetales bacterium]
MHINDSRDGRHSARLIAAMVVCGIVLGSVSGYLWSVGAANAEDAGPALTERELTIVVKHLLDHDHLSRRRLDDEISHRALKSFLEQLDSRKMYFLQSDIDEFQEYDHKIDDLVTAGDISLGRKIFDRYLQRVDDRLKDIEKFVDMDHDFTVDEQLEVDWKNMSYAKDEAEVRDRWRKMIKFEYLSREADDVSHDEAKEKIRKRYRSLDKRLHQTDNDELFEMFLSSVTSAYDPHTTFMSRDTLENFNITMKLNLEGIGAALKYEDGYTVVSNIIPGGAADKAGQLKPEDQIVSVGQGTDGEMVDVVDLRLRDVVNMIRGTAGTVVRLGVSPAEGGETKIYSITRARVELKDSEARGEIIEESPAPTADGVNPAPVKIGVVNLPSFYMDMGAARRGLDDFKSTTRDVRRILDDFRAKNVDVVILDLRENGGGSLTEAINLTGLFIDQGPVVQVKDADGQVQHYDDLERGMAWDGPLVVLTSKFSASASEILAGAIQDYHRGLIVGDESTHGKGTVQSLLDIGQQLFRLPNPPNFGALKITMQQFYRPKGDSTQKRGVLADVPLPSLTSQMDVGESDLDYAVEFDRVKPVDMESYNHVSHEMLLELRALSADRRKTSEDFDSLETRIRRYREQKDRKTVTLVRDAFLAERKEMDAEKAEKEEFEQQMNNDRPVVDRDYYFNEVINIAVDYLNLMQKSKVAQR